MSQEELFKEFVEKICPYCKAKCTKGITLIKTNESIEARCVDYEKDTSKIEGYKRPLRKTAKLERTVMGLAGCDWS